MFRFKAATATATTTVEEERRATRTSGSISSGNGNGNGNGSGNGNVTPENPFATPVAATPVAPSLRSRRQYDRTPSSYDGPPSRRRFKSSRLVGDFEKPWLDRSKRQINWDTIIFYSCVFIGLGIGGYLCWDATRGVPNHEYCLVMDDQFANLDNWNHEVQMNGYGTGAFDWTTTDRANSYIDGEGLHIVPTLTLESTDLTYEQLVNGHTVNLTTDGRPDGECTANKEELEEEAREDAGGGGFKKSPRPRCAAASNATLGTIINPVRSARLNTRGKASIRYGRVEVTARMPQGDWLWPAIWMMPQDSAYGAWPRSGEIDIAEARGNDARGGYPMGDNLVSSALHWGTATENNRWRMTYNEWGGKRVRYSEGFHTYGLEWSDKYLFTWLDGRLRQIFYLNFSKNRNMWTYGKFAGESVNGSVPVDPWTSTGRPNTPFDQPFYLILNVAVGSTNGWFPDAVGGKPWADLSETPMQDFWKANATWLPSWGPPEQRGMVVKSVKMWQQGAC